MRLFDVTALVRAYENGDTLQVLARRHRMSRTTVKKFLRASGVTIRTRGESMRGERNPNWSGDNPSEDAARHRAHKAFPTPEPCARCGTTEKPTRHHIDHNPANNSPENIEWMCRPCHARHHGALKVPAPCGSDTAYRRGCRCSACRSAHAAAARAYKAKKAA